MRTLDQLPTLPVDREGVPCLKGRFWGLTHIHYMHKGKKCAKVVKVSLENAKVVPK